MLCLSVGDDATMCAFAIPCAVPGRPHRASLNQLPLVRPLMTASSSHFLSGSSPGLSIFASRYLVCFHTNTNCPICNSFVLITIQNARGVGGAGYARVKVILELHESQITDHESLTLLECAVPGFRVLSPLECAVTKRASYKSFRMRSYKKRWGGGSPPNFDFLFSSFTCRKPRSDP